MLGNSGPASGDMLLFGGHGARARATTAARIAPLRTHAIHTDRWASHSDCWTAMDFDSPSRGATVLCFSVRVKAHAPTRASERPVHARAETGARTTAERPMAAMVLPCPSTA